MSRTLSFAPGEYYHIYNRGTDKRIIFNNDYDRNRFLVLLYLANSSHGFQIRTDVGRKLSDYFNDDRGETLVDVCCYCLMPNHFHVLVKEKVEGGITKFLLKLKTSYSSYYNKKNERKGTLFETTFKAEHVDNDNYLKYLFSYIHLNPVKLIDPAWKENGVRDFNDSYNFLKQYEYSSYLDYLNDDRVQKVIIDQKTLPEYFVDRNAVENEIFDWLNFKKDIVV
ncbi:MAG: transposase [Minisyncoccia bacterium]